MKHSFLVLLMLSCFSLFAQAGKICILGSCSGTEPIPNRHHTALILETGGRTYQFDAGENCAHTAATNNIDLLNLRALFISHPHFDHVGGLHHLFWTRQKIQSRYKRKPAVSPLPIYTPAPHQIEAAIQFFAPLTSKKNTLRTKIATFPISAGVFFDDGTIKVEAIKNRHCKPALDGTWLSFSFRIYAAGKKIVFSGDIKGIEELDPFLGDCDILLVETGHHHPWEIAAKIRQNSSWHVKKLIFIHHGRDYLNHPEKTLADTAKAWGGKVIFADDGMNIKL